MKIGNIVRFSPQFLDDIGASKSPLAYATGTVIEIDNGIATVEWDSARIPRHISIQNLKTVGNVFHGSPIIVS